MIGRALSLSVAFGFTLTAVAGIVALVALDFVGEDTALALVSSAASGSSPKEVPVATVVEELPALAGAKDITFFNEQPIEGLPFSVVTGVKYASPQALVLNTVAERWCYIMAPAPDGVLRKIELAAQEGAADPVFELLADIDESQLALFRMGAAALEAVARSHCKFDFTTPAAGGAE